MVALPFLHIEVILFEHQPTQDVPEPPTKKVIARILPDEIGSYHPGYHFGTIIVMKNGMQYMTGHETKALDFNIAQYWTAVQKKIDENGKESKIVTLN